MAYSDPSSSPYMQTQVAHMWLRREISCVDPTLGPVRNPNKPIWAKGRQEKGSVQPFQAATPKIIIF